MRISHPSLHASCTNLHGIDKMALLLKGQSWRDMYHNLMMHENRDLKRAGVAGEALRKRKGYCDR